MPNEERELWAGFGNKCLQRASELLDDRTAPAAATAEAVGCLVEAAVLMDWINLQWAAQSRSAAAVSRGRAFRLKAEES